MTTLHDSILEKPAERKSIGAEQSEVSSSGPSSLAPESLSSASSFQSLSSKSSSGICADSAPGSPDKTVLANTNSVDGFDHSYVNVDIPDLDDLISACANINLGGPRSQYREGQESPDSTADLSQDQTFASAADDTIGDVTQVHVEETIQTFKTCPGLETQASEEFKVPQLADQTSSSSSGDSASSISSVIPYVSFEQSVLKQNQDEEKVVAPLLKVDSPRRRSFSPTPCEEIDVAQVTTQKSDTSLVKTENIIGQKVATADGYCTPDVSFQEVQAFNSTIPVNTDCNISAAKTPEKSNLTTFVSAPEFAVQNPNDIIAQDKVDAFEKVEAAQENKVLNKTQEIVFENNPLNKTQDIVGENNILNKTQEIEKENRSLNKTQEVIKEDSFLNKTQEILKENNSLNKTQVIIKEEIPLNKTQELIREEIPLNKTQESIKENLLNKTQEFVKEASLNQTQEIVKEEDLPIKAQDTSKVLQQEPVTPPTFESAPVNTNKVDNFKEPFITVKTPSKLYENKESTPQNVESFNYDESQSTSEVVASTPLHWKKDENQRTPKQKSALFNQETKSPPPQFPSPPTLSKAYNSPSKDKATKEHENKVNFDQTVAVNRSFDKSSFSASELISKNSSLELLPQQVVDYDAFKPQQQSTTLPYSAQNPNFEALQEAALSVAKEIDESLEKIEEEPFVSATTELFGDPSAFDFLTQAGGSQTSRRGERYDSLYMKFDPLAQRQSMLPQKNLPASPALKEEEERRDSKADTAIGNADTPKKNPALSAIDRLLLYSPCPPATTDSEKVEAKQKKEEAEKKEPQSVPVVNEEMAKELEFVRSTVLQLEAELEKQKKEHDKQLEKQRLSYDEKVMQIQSKFGQMQSQLSQETKCKDQMTVVVDEYEKSISRLIAEREKEKQSFTQERDRLKAELDISQQHLANSEAAFTDVHSKYERLKSVVTAYKSNEEVLKESITENQETIKTLENRYEQLKSHAMAQLEKANLELSAIKKQHEADVLKLKAMVRKTELRCKTLEETVEQKSKENKELTQIIDEMIARVD